MPIKYILDDREKYLELLFKKSNVNWETKHLDLGDIVILYSKDEIPNQDTSISSEAKKFLKLDSSASLSSGSLSSSTSSNEIYTLVIERKSYTDLKASMSDGRYHEQKSRYIQLSNGSVYYILENNDPKFKELGRDQFLGTYIHTIVRDRLNVFLTNSIEETFEYLMKIGQTLEKFGINNGTNKTSNSSSYSGSIEHTQIKKKKLDPKEIYIQQISCFPGISSGKAKIIAEVYPDMKSLIYAIETNTFKVKGIGGVLLGKLKECLLITQNKTENSTGNATIIFE